MTPQTSNPLHYIMGLSNILAGLGHNFILFCAIFTHGQTESATPTDFADMIRVRTHLNRALPDSILIQSRAKSICRTNGDIRSKAEWATFRTTDGCSFIMLR